MEWVETTGKTVEEAKDFALDKLGVDDAEAEFEVLEEPRQGLFGRTRGQARVRARVAPKAPRAKEDRKRRRKSGGGGGGGGGKSDGASQRSEASEDSSNSGNRNNNRSRNKPAKSGDGGQDNKQDRQRGGSNQSNNAGSGDRGRRGPKPMKSDMPESPIEEVEACVNTFLTGLTEAFGLDAPVEIDTSDDEVYAQIQGKHGLLLGPKARTLDAIQELTRITAQRSAPSSIRIKVDVGGYREQRSAALGDFARQAAAKAIDEGVEVVLEPMSPPDRKVVHDALNDVEGVSTRSAGADPRRRVIVVPDEDATADTDETQDAPVDDVEETDAD